MSYPGVLPPYGRAGPDNIELPEYFCPVCGARLTDGDMLAEDKDGDTVGCDRCIRYYEIWERKIDN